MRTKPGAARIGKRSVHLLATWLLFSNTAAFLAGQETGSLYIQCQPGIEVVWAGVSLGRTDGEGRMFIEGIPPGVHSVVLHKPGFQSGQLRLDVEPGGGEMAIELEPLLPLPPVTAPPQERPVVAPTGGLAASMTAQEPLTTQQLPAAQPPNAGVSPVEQPPVEKPRAETGEKASEDSEPATGGAPAVSLRRRLVPPGALHEPQPPTSRPSSGAAGRRAAPPSWALPGGLVLLFLIVTAAVAFIALRRGHSVPPSRPPVQRYFPPIGSSRVEASESCRLFENLRRREQELEWETFGGRGREERTVIEIVDLPIVEVEKRDPEEDS